MKSAKNPIPHRMTAAEAAALDRRDKRRLALMVVAVVVVGGGFLFSRFMKGRYEQQELDEQPLAPEHDEPPPVVVVAFDMPEVLRGIRDATEDERLLIDDQDALAKVLDYGRLFTGHQYEKMGVRLLDEAALAEILSDPAAHRVQPFRARGRLLALGARGRIGNTAAQQGILRQDDGSCVHFVAVEVPEDLEVGDFARVDGVFFKLFRAEAGPQWCEGPLLLGREALRAYAPLVLGPDLAVPALEDVEDDTLTSLTGVPPEAEWGLMARALQGAGKIDWDAAPELNTEILGRMFQDGEAYRGQPFILPVSQNVGSHIQSVGENPLRLDQVTEGWIGNVTWKGAAAMIKYRMPVVMPELEDREGQARYVTGRGFFLKNINYERRSGKPGRVPYFVMESIEIFVPQPETFTRWLAWGVFAGTMALVLTFWGLLSADRKRAAQLQKELSRRRRARRARGTGGGPMLATEGPGAPDS